MSSVIKNRYKLIKIYLKFMLQMFSYSYITPHVILTRNAPDIAMAYLYLLSTYLYIALALCHSVGHPIIV